MRRMAFLAVAAMLATNAFGGYSYHFNTVVHAEQGDRTSGGTAWVDGQNTRIQYDSGDSMIFRDGAVVLSRDGGKTLTVLDAADKSYFEINLSDILNPTRMRANMPVERAITNPKVTVRDDGNGGDIDGYPTHKYTITSSYDMNINAMGRSFTNHSDRKSEVWTTEKIPAAAMSFIQMRGTRFGMPEMDKLYDPAQIKGFPVKQVVTTTSTGNNGTRTTTSETTVSQFQKTDIPASQFTTPADYKKVDMPMPQRPERMNPRPQ